MNVQTEIIDWLHGRPDWLQEAAMRILKNGTINDADLDDCTALCKTEAGQNKTKARSFPSLISTSTVAKDLSIVSISNIKGIENLAPRKPLKFGEGNLHVVFGNNGSGKSGYTRILKKVCGKAHAVDLRPNVFELSPSKRCCTIKYQSGGAMQCLEWEPTDKPVAELAAVDIFDTECGKFYLKENEASYIPDAVALFDMLVKACEGVKQRLQAEMDKLPSKLPTIPTNFQDTETGRIYGNLKPTQTEANLTPILAWIDADKQALYGIEERLKTDDPAKLAIQKRAKKVQVEAITNKLTGAITKLSSDNCQHVLILKSDARQMRTIATEGAKAILASATLGGIGSQTWRALWEAARQYSKEEAYTECDYPHTEDGAKCVLCQQTLQPEAQQRLRDFEGFVTGSLETAANTAEKARDEAIKALPQIPTQDDLSTFCQAAGLENDLWLPRFTETWKVIAQLVGELKTVSEKACKGILPQVYPWLEDLHNCSKALEAQAKQHDADAMIFDRPRALKQQTELFAKQWTSQQAEAIKIELGRLRQIDLIDEQIKSTNHTTISKQAGIIAEKVITDAYIDRFNKELDVLGAKRIRVELVKARTTRGKAMHTIRLKGLKTNGITPAEILSEGERRIVELAAFLADVTGKTDTAPFIFDDPISSLDQDFEEKTIDRLITLSANRQVLIFTHRLSFLGILSDKASPETVCIRHEPWGAGEPGDIPLFAKKPEGALRKMLDERLKQAEKTLNQDGYDAYYPFAKAICSDLRILVERIVELVFFADVIQRHRREIQTKNKIGNLSKITSTDCSLVDEFMGKYSCYEHSQSAEAPVDVPLPEEIRNDINKLLTWHGEFKARV